MVPIQSEPKILVVEENEYHGLLMGRQISQRVDGSQVMIARGADEALRLARIQHFDVAVVDFVLSDCDGLSLLHSLHQLDPNLAIIVVAEQISERLTKEIFRHGCEELLIKDSSYYAVIPRMVAGLWQKKQQIHSRQPSHWEPGLRGTEIGARLQVGINREIRDCLDEIFHATTYILDLSEMKDNDLAEKIRQIEESALSIRMSLDKSTRQVFPDNEPEDWPAVNEDKSAGYALKSGR